MVATRASSHLMAVEMRTDGHLMSIGTNANYQLILMQTEVEMSWQKLLKGSATRVLLHLDVELQGMSKYPRIAVCLTRFSYGERPRTVADTVSRMTHPASRGHQPMRVVNRDSRPRQ